MEYITKAEIITIAYISDIKEEDIKDEIVNTAIVLYILPVIGESIFLLMDLYPDDYRVLHEIYIKPCLAFYVKYLHLSQRFLENPDLQVESRQSFEDIFAIAEQKQSELDLYVKAYYSSAPLTPKITKRLKAGFLI
ncbi:MAG: hypothetical protein ACOYLE_09195 [Bacteroidales bacterium]